MDHVSTYWERAATTRWGRYLTDAERRNLLAAMALVTRDGAQAMEVGCEGGRWSRYLLDRGWSVTGTDIDPNVLETCQERLPAMSTVLVSVDDERIPAETGSLDFLLVYEVQTVMQAGWFPAEAARVLKPGGVLAFTMHNPMSARGLVYLILNRTGLRRRSGHYYEGPSYRALRHAFRCQGLEPVREEGVAWFPFQRESNSALIPTVAKIEKVTGLRRLVSVSPWVIGTARRSPLSGGHPRPNYAK